MPFRDPMSWASSFLQLDEKRFFASEIAETWTLLASPLVILSACETAHNPPYRAEIDEYCGLDVAFRIAGARSVIAAMWPLADEVGVLASTILPTWILQH